MIVNYVIGGICILVSILIPVIYYLIIRNSEKVDAEIVEEIPFDNLLGQRTSWVVSIMDNGDVKRLYNTIYKSSRTKPKVGDKVNINKVSVNGKIRYVSRFQLGAMTLFAVLQLVLLWIFAFIAFGIIV